MSVSAARLPSPFAALLGYALRAAAPPKRRWLLALPTLAAALLGLIARAGPSTPGDDFRSAAGNGMFFLVLPLTCLVVGDAVLGAEVRSGTFALTWLSPVPFRTIALARWLGGWLVATAALAPAALVMCLVGGQTVAIVAMVIALAAAASAYIAVFLLIGSVAKRAAVWSIAFVLLVERLLGAALSGIAQLSPSWLGWTTFDDGLVRIAEYMSESDRRSIPYGWDAVTRLAILTVVLVALASWRLRHLKLTGAED